MMEEQPLPVRSSGDDVVKAPEDAGAKKSYKAILEQEITEGLREIERPASGLLISGLSAGLDVGFSLLLMAVLWTLLEGHAPDVVRELVVANMYSVGFLFVIMGRSELFTEHTTTAVLPVLHGRAGLGQLGRLWGLVYVSNVVGAMLFAVLAALAGPRLGIIHGEVLGRIAWGLVAHPAGVILTSAILAGWLMGLLSWLVTAARDTISQIFFVWLVTTAIGVCHLHHSIAGTVEVLAGVLVRPGPRLVDFGHFLFWATLGNAIGGTCFVALLKYGHVIHGGTEPRVVRLDEHGPKEKKVL